MKKYIVEQDKDKHYKSKGGADVYIPGNGYNIVWKDNGDRRVVANIPDYYKNPQGIANGIIQLLNEGNIVLPLEI